MTELAPVQDRITELGEAMLTWQKQLDSVLPSHMNTNRMMRLTYNVVRRTPKLLECSFDSIVGGMLEAAYLGLEPGIGGQCWLIPFAKQAVLIAGYRGLVQLALRSDQVQMLYANPVFDKDEFEHNDYPRVLEHKRFEPTDEDPDPGKLVAAYSIVSMHAGGEYYIKMNRHEIEAIRKKSPGARKPDSPWNSSNIYDVAEMWKKTVLRRHCKVLPMSVEYNRLNDLDQRADTGLPQNLNDNFTAMTQAEIIEDDEDKSKS